MAITLSYESSLSRVQIAVTGLAVDAVQIQRSTNELFWETVRGGVEMVPDAGVVDLDDYEFPLNTEVFYRVLDFADLGGTALESDSITVNVGDCEVWLKSVRYPMLNQVVDIATYSPLDQPGRASTGWPQGRSFPVATTDVSGAYSLEMTFRTETADQGRKLALTLAVGEIFYLQIPPDGNPRLPPRSMYLVVPQASIARLGMGEKRHLPVQLSEVAAPSPLFVGTTLVWQTVWNTLGDWPQLWNAEPTWRDLLQTVGSPNDLVVL